MWGALVEASEHLGSVGWEDTVNAALREIAALRRRLVAFEQEVTGIGDSPADQRT